ncbi:TOBE domain-containing protein [Mycoplasma sp. ATU-Cv-508]
MLGKSFRALTTGFKTNETVDIVIRPEDIEIGPRVKGHLQGEIKRVNYQGTMWEYIVKINPKGPDLLIQSTHKFAVGTKVGINWEWEEVHLMKREVKKRV